MSTPLYNELYPIMYLSLLKFISIGGDGISSPSKDNAIFDRLKCLKLKGFLFNVPLYASESTKPITTLIGEFPCEILSCTNDEIPVESVNVFTSTLLIGYFAVVFSNIVL